MTVEQILLARQPIVNATKEIVAYELLFRSNEQPAEFDGNAATSQVLLNAFTEIPIAEVTGGAKAFVNFTETLLMHPPPFSKELLVIEILETIELTDEIVTAIIRLGKNGFTLALDDYIPDTKYDELLPYVSIVKLEIPAIPKERLEQTVKHLKGLNITLLAEKVETHEEFEYCRDLGCDLFQGYFFSKPEIVTGRKLAHNRMAVMELIAKVQNPALSIDQIIKTITSDPSLSVKLLQLVNSAAYRRPRTIESIHMAVMLLGISRIKSWATLLALSNIEDKPKALITIALIRARMCELIAQTMEPKAADLYFTVGLFSCLEAFFDMPMEEILNKLPLSERVSDALVKMKGKPGLALHTTLQYERCKLDIIHWNLLEKMSLTGGEISAAYRQAIFWASEQSVFRS
ncbi:predicted signal transduction protein containing EAL and modified HD-GYP domains [Hahella chejuensis KCTC 2396]|uniref:Predicted signal transduction protein containing EAL and modified HD-GYP domains n=1 Tax=Hahella chejuensis (strain KCTC 2396) TaxID=349521 RepID=Q2SDX6_HAHCH|nr:HDOD domain-containing protein [Hahella chejuensis]ABC31148.1 predicted signal transduction protein containing EAL and modified HD-GYP domains [Hahella chejuensis KCTC 2396]